MEEDVFIVIIYIFPSEFTIERRTDGSETNPFTMDLYGKFLVCIIHRSMFLRCVMTGSKGKRRKRMYEYCDLTEAEEKSGGGNPRQFLSSLFPLPLNAYHRASGKNSRAKFKSWKETGRRGFNFEFAVI